MHLLKSNGIIKLSFFFGFAMRFAFTSLSSLRAENWSSPTIIILSVYMPTIPNRVPVVVIRKHRSNIEVVIKSFSLWCLL